MLIEDLEGKILALHRKESVLEGNKWGVPGGKKNKKTFIETAIGKTFQEARLKFKEEDLNFLGKFKYPAENNNITAYVWIAKTPKISPEINLNTDGHDQFMWEYPKVLLKRDDLMAGMYPILRKFIKIN